MCKTRYCRNTRGNKNTYCSTCRSRKSRLRDLYRYAFTTLKNNSKRRGISFELTFDEFKEFAVRVNYIGKKGITSTSYSIDRKDPLKGYTKDNIQLLKVRDNSIKKNMSYDWWLQTARYF